MYSEFSDSMERHLDVVVDFFEIQSRADLMFEGPHATNIFGDFSF